MNRDHALAKIKKCMALGRSANPHEAAAAMRQAQKLMAEHGLSDTDVELSDVTETTCAAALNAPDWEVFLANVVAQAFGCDVLWTATRKWIGHKPRRKMAALFIGVGSHPEIAGYAWQVLDRQCSRQRLDHIRQQPKSCKLITLTARGDAFAVGWVHGVRQHLQEFAGDRHQRLLDAYKATRFPGGVGSETVKSRAVGRNVRDDSRVAGFVAGRATKLAHGVGNDALKALPR
jgi:hypothetical protein